VGHHLKRTAQRKFDILKFGQLSAQLKKGGGGREKLVFYSSCSGCQRLAHHIRKGYPSLFLSPKEDDIFFKPNNS
jgi:hypothetical protein